MEFYSLVEAQFLLNLYAPMLVGRSIEPPNNYLITNLEIQEYENDNYRLICRVAQHAGVTIIADVAEVTARHNMITPLEALQNREENN